MTQQLRWHFIYIHQHIIFFHIDLINRSVLSSCTPCIQCPLGWRMYVSTLKIAKMSIQDSFRNSIGEIGTSSITKIITTPLDYTLLDLCLMRVWQRKKYNLYIQCNILNIMHRSGNTTGCQVDVVRTLFLLYYSQMYHFFQQKFAFISLYFILETVHPQP